MQRQRNRLWLVALGAAAVLIYDYAFSQPLNLPFLFHASMPADLGVITGYARHAAAFYVGAVSLLVAGYLVSVHLASHTTSGTSWRWVLTLGIGMALILVRTYPYAASDLFLYIARGRVLGIYGQSSMELAPVQVANSGYVPFWSEWMNTPSPYGPLWEWGAALLARLGDGSGLRSLIVFKLFNVVVYAGTGWLIHDTLRIRGRGAALAGLVAYAWNPLVLLEGLANGHNDLLMVFFLALALWCWERHRHNEFLLAIVCGGLVKWVPLMLMPFALVAMYQRLGWRRWLRVCATAGAISLVLIAATLAPLWPGWRQWALSGQMQQGHNSVFVWLVLTLQRITDAETAYVTADSMMRLAFMCGYLYLVVEAVRQRFNMVDLWYRALLLYMVVGATSFGYWYIIWLCALVPFVSSYRQRLWTLALTWTGLMSVPLYTYVGEWLLQRHAEMNVHLLAVPLILGLPFALSPLVGSLLPPALGPMSGVASGFAHRQVEPIMTPVVQESTRRLDREAR